MKRKRKKQREKRRSQFQQRYDEGYEAGLKEGIQKATAYFFLRIRRFEKRKGIGKKTMDLLKEEFGVTSFEGGRSDADEHK